MNSLIADFFGFSVLLTFIPFFGRELVHILKQTVLGALTEKWGIASKIQQMLNVQKWGESLFTSSLKFPMDSYWYFKLNNLKNCASLTWCASSCYKHLIPEGFLDLSDTL